MWSYVFGIIAFIWFLFWLIAELSWKTPARPQDPEDLASAANTEITNGEGPTLQDTNSNAESLEITQGSSSISAKRPRTSSRCVQSQDPGGLAFGHSYGQYTLVTMRCILDVARAPPLSKTAERNGFYKEIKCAEMTMGMTAREAKDFAIRQAAGLIQPKFNLWLTLLSLQATIGHLEKQDLTLLARNLANLNDEEALPWKAKIREYLQATYIDDRSRVPFYYMWFQGMLTSNTVANDKHGHLRHGHLRHRKLPGYPLSSDPFKIFRRTYQESSVAGLRLLYETMCLQCSSLRGNTEEMSKSELWINILNVFREYYFLRETLDIQSFENLSDLIYSSPNIDVDLFSNHIWSWYSHLKTLPPRKSNSLGWPSYFFCFPDFLRQLGLEKKDPNVGEFGVVVGESSEIPHSYYEPNLVCDSCLESLPRDRYLLTTSTSTCNDEHHEPKICSACLNDCVLAQINDENVLCPDCRGPLTYEDVKKWSTTDTFKKYDESLFKRWQANEKTFIECLSCKIGQINDGRGVLMTCVSCNYLMCSNHLTPWHLGESCEEYDARHKKRAIDEQLSNDFLAKRTKNSLKCPNCDIPLEKNGGCNHFICSGKGKKVFKQTK